MRKSTVLLALSMMVLGCAKPYYYLSIPVDKCASSPICIRVLEQGWDKNTACGEWAKHNELGLFRVSITNNSPETITLAKSDIKLKGTNGSFSAEEAQALSKMRVWPYALWLLLTITTSSSVDGVATSFQIYPIGLPIGIGNMLFAANSNEKLLNDLTKNSLDTLELKPNESKAGLIYLKTPIPNDAQISISCVVKSTSQRYESIEPLSDSKAIK